MQKEQETMKSSYIDILRGNNNHPSENTKKKDATLVVVNEDPLPLPTMSSSSSLSSLVDIGINLTHRTFRKNWQDVVQRAMDAGVSRMILTGTSMRTSRESIQLAKTWYNNNDGAVKQKKKKKNLFCTVGIHPHDAKSFEAKDNKTIREMRSLIQANKSLVVAIGECGLDFDRNYSSRDDQLLAFRQQVLLAIEMQMPLFVHERNAHEDLVRVLDDIQAATAAPRRPPLPPIVVHCFTGTHDEAQAYLARGYYIGFTGTICKPDRGEPLRNHVLPSIPLERILLETDAPFMSYIQGQRNSEPAHVVGVAQQLSETLGIPLEQVCSVTTATAIKFFRLDE